MGIVRPNNTKQQPHMARQAMLLLLCCTLVLQLFAPLVHGWDYKCVARTSHHSCRAYYIWTDGSHERAYGCDGGKCWSRCFLVEGKRLFWGQPWCWMKSPRTCRRNSDCKPVPFPAWKKVLKWWNSHYYESITYNMANAGCKKCD